MNSRLRGLRAVVRLRGRLTRFISGLSRRRRPTPGGAVRRPPAANSFAEDARRRTLLRLLALALAILISFPFAWRAVVEWYYADRVYSVDDVPPRRVAIVFGAGLFGRGLSPMLEDRVDAAVHLYQSGKARRLLFSGDNRFLDYNEPGRMVDYAVAAGVPRDAIQPDFGGRRTYDSCYRARDIFRVRSAILVSQAFHLPRALFTCAHLGLDVVAVAADRQSYDTASLKWSRSREFGALLSALVDVVRNGPAEVMGDPIPID